MGIVQQSKEIASASGLNERHISMYLKKLSLTGFVERRVPITEPATSRQGRHHIIDPFLRFHHRFLSRRQAQLALGVRDQALAEIKKHLVDFIGTHTWEELCRGAGHCVVKPQTNNCHFYRIRLGAPGTWRRSKSMWQV